MYKTVLFGENRGTCKYIQEQQEKSISLEYLHYYLSIKHLSTIQHFYQEFIILVCIDLKLHSL